MKTPEITPREYYKIIEGADLEDDIDYDFYITFRITDRCNLSCEYCHWNDGISYKLEDIKCSVDTLFELLEMKKIASVLFYFHGGEPTVHPNLIEIINYIKSMGNSKGIRTDTEVQTNLACRADLLEELVVIDKYTYSVKKYSAAKPSFELADEVVRQLNLFKDISPIRKVSVDILNEYIYKVFAYIEKNDNYSFDDLFILKEFYESSKEELIRLQSFAQGNCSFDRILTDGNSYFFDYFSIYEKEAYTGFLLDYGQFMVDVLHIGNRVSSYKQVSKYLDNNSYSKFILFFSLIQEEALEAEAMIKNFLWLKFKNSFN